MGRVDGLIIPRSYNDYFSRSDPQAIHDIVAEYTDDALSTTSELPVQNKIITAYAQPKILETPIEVDNVEETTVEGALGAINDKVKNFTAGVAFKGTRSAYNTAKLIPEGSDGHIPSGALVIITDEGRTYITNGTGSSQTLELVANATFNGSHAQWNALTSAQKAMYNIVNFNDDEAIGLTISDVVEDGNMNPVTSNAVAEELNPLQKRYVLESGVVSPAQVPANGHTWQEITLSHTYNFSKIVFMLTPVSYEDCAFITVSGHWGAHSTSSEGLTQSNKLTVYITNVYSNPQTCGLYWMIYGTKDNIIN